jgi:hypothetical protein
MVGLVVTCLPSLRPYLRHNFKASSGSNSHGYHGNTIGGSKSITVNRKVITSNVSGRWREHGEFEEIMGAEETGKGKDGHGHGRIITIGNDVHIDGGKREGNKSGGRDSWQDDRRSNNSDIELIHVKGSS